MSQIPPPYFEQNKNQSGQSDIDRLFYVGVQTTVDEGYQIGSHWHFHMEIIYIASGNATITVGSDRFEAAEGTFILIHPCEVHNVSIAPYQASRHYVIGFDPELLRPMPQLAFELQYYLPYITPLAGLNKWIVPEVQDKPALHDLVEDMYREYKMKEFGFELAVSASIFKLILWLLRDQRALLSPDQLKVLGEETLNMSAFRQLLASINDNVHQTISAEEAAMQCMMSYSQFARFFKSVMHTSFTQYVMFIKIRRAEQLLLDPLKSITQITLETGFNHSSYFIKQFKRLKGISPKRYRKEQLLMQGKA
ncbi:AraC family transcriptional regulator [Paenibacillus sp. MAH-36]|uniref:AraC family transcriptional regulator n=1 Tax=Paenibacillus violae TaxID=3077234 RepID=A0ABU3RDJ2_9BACL|nr:AraC family transcriptional regulator [Paenibacillus sp. PFR10]MDU0202141.1 AraC family transcriptional regulator [Paenibacillus sp. PFR10]